MTTGVNVDFISNCFFTCKDRALERDRPYLRKKNNFLQPTDPFTGNVTFSGLEP